MEEMQQALRGKTHIYRLLDCMQRDAECSFLSDNLDNCVLKNENSQNDNSIVINKFS